jgi:DNA modification methylase
MVLGLHSLGKTPDDILKITGSPRASIKRYIEDFTTGMNDGKFDPFFGQELSTGDFCKLHGVWTKVHGDTAETE